MTKLKLTVLIALKFLLISSITMAISLYLMLTYLPNPSIFDILNNPNPAILWPRVFGFWFLLLAIIGLVILVKNKFANKNPSTNSNELVKPLISTWLIFVAIAIPSGLLTMRITNYFSPSLRRHVNYHLVEAARFNDSITLLWLFTIASKDQLDPLLEITLRNSSDASLRILMAIGIKPNENDLKLLMIEAAANGNNNMLQLLKDQGISIDITTSYGQYPLLAAVEHNKIDTVKFLLSAGADPNKVIKGSYPLLITALLNDNTEIAKTLIKAGVDLKSCLLGKDFSLARKDISETQTSTSLTLTPDSTPLMLAAASANVEALKALIEAKADVNITNSQGYTALMCAKASVCSECEQILVNAGAK